MPESPLEQAQALSISHLDIAETPVVGIVLRNSPDGISLELIGDSLPLSFIKGDLLAVKFWHDTGTYTGRTQIMDTFGPTGQGILISQPDHLKVEKRRFPRYSVTVPISFTVTHSTERPLSSSKVYSTQTKVLSAGGAEFETEDELLVGEILSMRVPMSSKEELEIMARVVRSQPTGESRSLAVQFLMLAPAGYDKIQQFLESCNVSPRED